MALSQADGVWRLCSRSSLDPEHLPSTAPNHPSASSTEASYDVREPSLTQRPSRPLSAQEEQLTLGHWILYLQRCGRCLLLPNRTVLTSCVFLQRFFVQCPLQSHCPLLVCMAALVLAAKVEENGRRVRDIINVCYRQIEPTLLLPIEPVTNSGARPTASIADNERERSSCGDHQVVHVGPVICSSSYAENAAPLAINNRYWCIKDWVLRYEQLVLRVLSFELSYTQPHCYLLHITRVLECSTSLATLAFYILNDACQTRVALQYAPPQIACAAVFLAAQMVSEVVSAPNTSSWPSNTVSTTSSSIAASSTTKTWNYNSAESDGDWYEEFGGNRMQIEDIVHQIMDMYELMAPNG